MLERFLHRTFDQTKSLCYGEVHEPCIYFEHHLNWVWVSRPTDRRPIWVLISFRPIWSLNLIPLIRSSLQFTDCFCFSQPCLSPPSFLCKCIGVNRASAEFLPEEEIRPDNLTMCHCCHRGASAHGCIVFMELLGSSNAPNRMRNLMRTKSIYYN